MKVVERLRGMGFIPMKGQYDHVYDWRGDVGIEEILKLGNTVHNTLRGFKVLYKMETN